MLSLMLTIFILTLVSYVLNTLAPTLLTDVFWKLYTTLSPPHRQLLQTHRTLLHDYHTTRTALNSISAQNQFAKWAKLRRHHDALTTKLESLTSQITTTRTQFTTRTRFLRWLLTTGIRWAVGVWYVKEAVLWVPKGWVPPYVEGLLAFPRAQRGGVSVQVWGMACTVVVEKVVGGGVWGVGEVVEWRRRSIREKEKMKVLGGEKKEEEKVKVEEVKS